MDLMDVIVRICFCLLACLLASVPQSGAGTEVSQERPQTRELMEVRSRRELT